MNKEDYTSVYMQGYYNGKDKAFEQNEQERQEYRKLLDKHKQLENNWNELKKWLEEESKLKGSETAYLYYGKVLNKMQELEQGKDEN